MHIDVVGGGIAGLYAAYKLKRRGLDVCVYEKSRRLGGRIGTVRFAGRDVPTGAERTCCCARCVTSSVFL
jgi:protoporphyrinogen oxidase